MTSLLKQLEAIERINKLAILTQEADTLVATELSVAVSVLVGLVNEISASRSNSASSKRSIPNQSSTLQISEKTLTVVDNILNTNESEFKKGQQQAATADR